MSFRQDEVEALLAACHRRCCICRRFCGVKVEIDHMQPTADGGPDDIGNAIPVCFECHAEIHSYNDRHPRGRKFRPDELRLHKNQWLVICRENPKVFARARRDPDVGPLQALIDELEFNGRAARHSSRDEPGCPFQDEQFRRAIREGAIATLDKGLKEPVLDAYVAIGRANQHISGVMTQEPRGNGWAEAVNRATKSIIGAKGPIEAARSALLRFLGSAERDAA